MLSELGRGREAEAVAEKALIFARASGVHREQVMAQMALVGALHDGPTPVPAAITRCEELLAAAPDSLVGTVPVSAVLGVLHAMNGEFDTARQLAGHSRSILQALAHPRPLSTSALRSGRIEMLAGELTSAEKLFRDGCAIARQIGYRRAAGALAVRLAEVLCRQGRTKEALRELQEVPLPWGSTSGVESVLWRITRARVLTFEGGDIARAVSLATGAATLVASTDLLDLRGDVALTLAEVLSADGQLEAATAARSRAIHFYLQKGNIVGASHARAVVPTSLM